MVIAIDMVNPKAYKDKKKCHAINEESKKYKKENPEPTEYYGITVEYPKEGDIIEDKFTLENLAIQVNED